MRRISSCLFVRFPRQVSLRAELRFKLSLMLRLALINPVSTKVMCARVPLSCFTPRSWVGQGAATAGDEAQGCTDAYLF